MGSSESLRSCLLCGIVLVIMPLAAQTGISESEYTSLARRISARFADPYLPRSEFSTITATLDPGIYRTREREIGLLPVWTSQWWVSPNLALYGGLGAGINQEAIIQIRAIGLRFLPGILELGRFVPELTFSQHRIEGDRDYTLKWNELRLFYALHAAKQSYAVGLMLQYPRMFPSSASRAPGVPSRLELNQRALAITASHEILPWLQLTIYGIMSLEDAAVLGTLLVNVAI